MYLTDTELHDAVAYLTDHELNRVLAIASELSPRIIREPSRGIVMMTLIDSFEVPFHLGEVLVTEAEVECAGAQGYGMTEGLDGQRALVRAILDALSQITTGDVVRERIRVILSAAYQRRRRAQGLEDALIASSRVSFDLLPGA